MTTPTTDISPLGLTRHSVKTPPLPFAELCQGIKTAEIRRLDRGYAVGHEVLLQEFDPLTQAYTGNALPRTITHIQEGYGLPEGVGVLSYGEVNAKIEQMSIADEQVEYTEDEHFVAEYMLQHGFEMVDDNAAVFAGPLSAHLDMLRAYLAPMFTDSENIQTVDRDWLTQLRNEYIAAGDQCRKLTTERDDARSDYEASDCVRAKLQLQVDTLTCALRKIVLASGVNLGDYNLQSPGPDLMALAVDVLTKLQEPQVFPMETAPTDGTRVLILNRQHGYDSKLVRYVPHGEAWVECWYSNGKWEEWCGSFKITSSAVIDPLEWAHIPDAAQLTRTETRDVWAQPANVGQLPEGTVVTGHDPLTQICISDAAQLGQRNKSMRLAGWTPNEGRRPAQPGTLVDVMFEDGGILYSVDIVKVSWEKLDKKSMNITHWRMTLYSVAPEGKENGEL